MAGRRPIFATLVTNLFWGTRDFFFKIMLEPDSHEERREKEAKKESEKKK